LKILLAEDDKQTLRVVTQALEGEGYSVDAFLDGAEANYYAEQDIYDLLVLDIKMPGLSGSDLLKNIRSRGISVPVIFTTAQDSIPDRVAGLGLGADDYLVKPYALDELLARVSALLRRASGRQDAVHIIEYGPVKLDGKTMRIMVPGGEIQLTGKEYNLFEYLLVNRGRIITRAQIANRIWGMDSDLSLDIIDVHMHNLRKKLATQEVTTDLIKTVRGVGYMVKLDGEIG
jgi:DNA-binding response OmpR family regulator